MEERLTDRDLRDNARFLRITAIVMFAGIGCVALHAVDAKTGPEEFFSAWTSWRSGNPVLQLLASLGLLSSFLAGFLIMGSATKELVPGLTKFGAALRVAAFPAVIAAFITTSNSPRWFAVAVAATSLAIAAALALRHALLARAET